jgi:hypothetical protein
MIHRQGQRLGCLAHRMSALLQPAGLGLKVLNPVPAEHELLREGANSRNHSKRRASQNAEDPALLTYTPSQAPQMTCLRPK